jgi:hypothetical protein
VAEIAPASPQRLAVVAANIEAIQQSFSVVESRSFPLSLPSATRLSLHLDRLLEYVKADPRGRSRRVRRADVSDTLSNQMKFVSMSGSGSMVLLDQELDFKPFAGGFLRADVRALQSQISDSRGILPDSIEGRVVSVLTNLFAAHVDAFTRDHALGAKSTRPCYELVSAFCSAIIECTSKSLLALNTNDTTELVAAVKKHSEAIQAVHQEYADRPVFTGFGHNRLMIFAHLCCVLGQITALNAWHLASQDSGFHFDTLDRHIGELNELCAQLPQWFNALPVLLQVKEVESTSSSILYEESPERIVLLLQAETRFCDGLADMAALLNAERDLRFWRAPDTVIELSSPVIAAVSPDQAHTHSSHLKRSLQIINEKIVEFRTALDRGQVSEGLLLAQLARLDEASSLLSSNAILAPSAPGFRPFVQRFREQIVRFVNCLKNDLKTGTYVLYSAELEDYIEQSRSTTVQLIKHLGLMEQLEEDTIALDVILARQVKLLYLAQDDLYAIAKRQDSEEVTTLAALIANGYGAVSQVLLTVKNAGPRVEKVLRTEKIGTLRDLLFALQTVLNAAANFELVLTGFGNESVESPEFMFKSKVEPILNALQLFRRSIPSFIPSAATLNFAMRSIISDITIAIEPSYEERPDHLAL